MNDDANELIRAAFERAANADPQADGGSVADAVRSAASKADKLERVEAKAKDREPKEPRDRGRLVMALGGVGLALALVGGVLAVAIGGSSGAESITTANQTVHMYRCPGAEPVGTLRRGEEVRSVARSHDAKWLAVKFPIDVAEQVWVPSSEVSSDVPVSELPVARCSSKSSVDFASKKTTTTEATSSTVTGNARSNAAATTTTAAGSTPTTTAKVTTTTAPPKGRGSGPSGPSSPTAPAGPTPTAPAGPTPTAPPTTAPPPPPPTTLPPDTTPPAISGLGATPTQIYENAGTCSGSTPKSTAIAVTVTDAGGVASVSMAWKASGAPLADQSNATSRAMALSSGKYRATLGPFGDVKSPGVTLVLTVTATDGAGNKSTASINVTLFSCG